MLVGLGIFIPDSFQEYTETLRNQIATNFGWFYLLLVTGVLGLCIFFMVSPIGKIRLGKPSDKPEYSMVSWIAMMFSAGMGIGLVFYGAAEPLSHYASLSPQAPIGSQEALADAFQFSFFHWGVHAWGVYALIGLALAYFGFRKQEKYLLSTCFKPLLGKHAQGKLGNVIDVITIIATALGVATTLGLGAAQINAGLSFLFGIPDTQWIQTLIIIIATILFILSAVSGVGKGVKILSNVNLILAIGLLAIAIVMGPTVQIFNSLTESIGNYLQNFFTMSFRTGAFDLSQQEWINTWTIFYWAWWISWSPFVGVFIARISKGRTIREFVSVVLFIPSLLSFLWFSTFGTLSTNLQTLGVNLSSYATEEVLFATFEHYPLGQVLSMVAIILVITFFVTSADSATFVLAMLSENGNIEPSNKRKIVWGTLLAIVAIVLLFSGGLNALQNVMIIGALPFAIVMVGLAISIVKELFEERKRERP